MNIRERLTRIEEKIRRRFCPCNDTNFIEALGLNPADFYTPQGYDYIAALNSIAAETWADYVQKDKDM